MDAAGCGAPDTLPNKHILGPCETAQKRHSGADLISFIAG